MFLAIYERFFRVIRSCATTLSILIHTHTHINIRENEYVYSNGKPFTIPYISKNLETRTVKTILAQFRGSIFLLTSFSSIHQTSLYIHTCVQPSQPHQPPSASLPARSRPSHLQRETRMPSSVRLSLCFRNTVPVTLMNRGKQRCITCCLEIRETNASRYSASEMARA